MNEQLLRNFINLVTFDQTLLSLERDVKITSESIDSLKAQKARLLDLLDSEKKAVVALRKEVDECELTMKTLDQDEKNKKKRLEQVSTTKEYAAIKAEIERVQEKQRELENVIIESWGRLDNAQKKQQLNQDSSKNKVEEIDDSIGLLEQKLSNLRREVEEQTTERKRLELLVPEELMNNYRQMRGRVANPVVPVQFGSCSACFYSVPAQEMSLLKSGVLLPCKSCYRILYSPEVTEEQL